ncbi:MULTISPECIES: ABC transporter ATP-binding protein [Cohnella]|uniref:ABC transporter ATP-binding protein n=1 Tax=Cohnella TaxID=329857 RepID=UPI001592EC59|nr:MULTISPECIES: ABC transporter ATP-binding protein [Cohnella]MBN2981240.1 ABC transporter ATP-binding protein [Cohnella algarum]
MDRSDHALNGAISLKNITKRYKDVTVVENINLELAKGQFLSLLGPSGSGKTTLLRMIAGLAQPDGGQIVLNGRDIISTPANKRNFGMVFQQYALFPHMTVWDNVAYGLKARKESKSVIKERVEKYLAMVGLSHLAGRKPKQLSGGQQQRVSLARALAVEPVLMLFDEPLSNLDARLKEQMLKEIRSLHRSLGFTAIFVTHDQNEALYLSDKIAVLNKGKIEQFAAPEEIITSPVTPFVADFFGYTNRLEGAELVGRGLARIGSLDVPVGHAVDGADGAKGVVLLRPNALQIADGERPGTVAATVADSRYLGGATEYRLRLEAAGGAEMTVITQRLVHPLPAAGSSVRCEFLPESVAFFKEG